MRRFRICFSLFLIISVFGLLLYPSYNARAVVGVKFAGCTTGGLLAPWLTKKIDDGLAKLLKKFPKLNKYFGGIAGNDVPVKDASFLSAWNNKELRGDILARCTAREIFNAMSKGIADNARTAGRNGGPAYVRNWRNFQTDAQYRGEGIFRAVLSNTELCDYFDKNIKNLFGTTQKTSLPGQNTRTGNFDPYALRANCTMPSNFSMTNYQKDFAGNGGWQAFSRMLEPQNNYYGTLFASLEEAAKQRALEESADLNQVLANKGLIGKSGNNANDSCKSKDANGKCLAYKDIKTPGSIISDSVAATIQQELSWVVSIDEVSEVISAATEILLNRLLDFSNPNEGDYTIYEDPQLPDLPPEPEEGTCPVPTTPSSLCQNVDSATALGILQAHEPTNDGITEALPELQAAFGSHVQILFHPERLDKIDFGGGMIVDVIVGAGGDSPSWGWMVECPCGGEGGGGGGGGENNGGNGSGQAN